MEVRMAEIMAEYDWQLAVIIALSVVVGMMIGLLIAGKKTKKKSKAIRSAQDSKAVAGLPTIGSARHGEKVTICGAEWTVM